jgi:hypothetical protein
MLSFLVRTGGWRVQMHDINPLQPWQSAGEKRWDDHKVFRPERQSEPLRREILRPLVASGHSRLRSALVVLVVAAPPNAARLFVAPFGGAVEPLVHAPEAVQSARIGGIGVVDDALLEYKRAHARPVARVRGRVGSGHSCVLSDGLRDLRCIHRVAAALVVVFDAAVALLLLGERNVEVEVEITA